MQIRFRYIIEDRDRHGNIRVYVRVPGRRKVRIRAPFGTDKFIAAYNAAISEHVSAPRQARVAKTGSFRHVSVLYYTSATFKRLDPATQSWRRRALDSMCEKHADKPVALMEARHVRALRDERSDRPGAANTRLKALKALFVWACEEKPELAPQNPTLGVRKIKYATNGHHSWSPGEITQYRDRHPIGSNARLALDLLLYTGGRREDAVRLGSQHVRNGRIKFRQAKNEHRNPIDIDIPLHSELEASIVATPSGHLTFLITEFGRPFTPAGFGNWFRARCDEAGLHHCSGLRKACATALAEAGASTHEIAEQARPMAEACTNGKIKPSISFHILRHTWASLAVMNGTPLLVVAKNLGHADTRMVEKHYGHLAPSFIADAIRAGAPRWTTSG